MIKGTYMLVERPKGTSTYNSMRVYLYKESNTLEKERSMTVKHHTLIAIYGNTIKHILKIDWL